MPERPALGLWFLKGWGKGWAGTESKPMAKTVQGSLAWW